MLLWPDILKLSSIIKKNTMEQPAVKKALFCLINGQIETDGAETPTLRLFKGVFCRVYEK